MTVQETIDKLISVYPDERLAIRLDCLEPTDDKIHKLSAANWNKLNFLWNKLYVFYTPKILNKVNNTFKSYCSSILNLNVKNTILVDMHDYTQAKLQLDIDIDIDMLYDLYMYTITSRQAVHDANLFITLCDNYATIEDDKITISVDNTDELYKELETYIFRRN